MLEGIHPRAGAGLCFPNTHRRGHSFLFWRWTQNLPCAVLVLHVSEYSFSWAESAHFHTNTVALDSSLQQNFFYKELNVDCLVYFRTFLSPSQASLHIHEWSPDLCSAECSACSASGALFSPTALPFLSASGSHPQHYPIVPAAFLVLHLPPGLSPRYQERNLSVLDLPHWQRLHFSGYHLEAQNDMERRGIQDLWISACFLDLDSSENTTCQRDIDWSKNFSSLGPHEICLPMFV